jgi:hypothetical protein
MGISFCADIFDVSSMKYEAKKKFNPTVKGYGAMHFHTILSLTFLK